MLLARFLSQPVSKWVRNERVSWSPWGDIGMWPGSLICFLSFPLSFGFVSRHLGLRFCRALISLLFCPPPTCTKPSGSIGARTMQVSSGQVPVEGHRAGPSPPPPNSPVPWEASFHVPPHWAACPPATDWVQLVRSPIGEWKNREASIHFFSPCGVAIGCQMSSLLAAPLATQPPHLWVPLTTSSLTLPGLGARQRLLVTLGHHSIPCELPTSHLHLRK